MKQVSDLSPKQLDIYNAIVFNLKHQPNQKLYKRHIDVVSYLNFYSCVSSNGNEKILTPIPFGFTFGNYSLLIENQLLDKWNLYKVDKSCKKLLYFDKTLESLTLRILTDYTITELTAYNNH